MNQDTLPTGLVQHCDTCNIVIPSDAPRPDEADCEDVVRSKLTWFDPHTTLAAQHCMATAAWALIHDKAIKASHPESVEYLHQFKLERKEHYAQSAARQAMTPEQVQADITLVHALTGKSDGKRDSHLYEQTKER